MVKSQVSKKGVLCLIPAKGGSTRLPRKNILPVAGKPMLTWTAEAAIRSGLFERIVCSTDDVEVADIASQSGLEVPFMRPSELGYDPYGVSDVAIHALGELASQGCQYQTLVILLPTSPLRTEVDISEAYKLFESSSAEYLMSVSAYSHTPFAAMKVDESGYLHPHFPGYFYKKSQDHPLSYRPNGAIHIVDVDSFRRTKNYISEPLMAYIMSPERSIDVDNMIDLKLAEIYLKERILVGR